MNYVVFTPFYPPHVGGLEMHAQQWTDHMAKAGNKILVFTSNLPKSKKYKQSAGKNVLLYFMPSVEIVEGYPFPNIFHSLFWHGMKEIFAFKPDFIVTRTRFFVWSCIGGVIARLSHVKWVHVEHGSDFVKSRSMFISWFAWIYDITLGHAVFHWSDRVVANSKASQTFVNLVCDKAKPILIKRGVEKDFILNCPPDNVINNRFSGKIIITFAGRLMSGKGVMVLLKAIKKVDMSNAVCLLAGDGPDKFLLEDYCRKNSLQDKVIFLGELSHTEVVSLLKNTDIFAHPSFTEGLPTAVIEAALCRCAIIATDVGGTQEIVSSSEAMLIPAHDIRMLAESLTKLINNQALRNTMANAAYERVIHEYNWDTVMKKYAHLFA